MTTWLRKSWRNFYTAFTENDLFMQALNESHLMLDLDLEMYDAAVKSLRHSDTGDLPIDVYMLDQKINAYERDVRRKIMTHLVVNPGIDLPPGMALVSIVIDIERIGDYTKNICDMAINHPKRLVAGSLENDLKAIEDRVSELFRGMITAFKTNDEDAARKIMVEYKAEISEQADAITNKLVSGEVTDLDAADAAATAMYARYLKRIAAHSRNIITSVVNPFDRIGYRE